jgi:hypothetical protein
MITLYKSDLTPEHSFINVRLPGTQNSYTYITCKPHELNDKVQVDARGKTVTGTVTEINVPQPTNNRFAYKCVLNETEQLYQFSAV